jgi:predicted nucleic acid-binding protein
VRIYLDSAPIIYLVEQVDPFAYALETHLVGPDTVQVCSDLTRLECRVKPMRDGQDQLLVAFDRYFADIISEVFPLSRKVIDQATILRARYGFKTPDCIHLGAAIVNNCDLFLTNDHRLRQCSDITVETV